mgnify:CR=1 FL=1
MQPLSEQHRIYCVSPWVVSRHWQSKYGDCSNSSLSISKLAISAAPRSTVRDRSGRIVILSSFWPTYFRIEHCHDSDRLHYSCFAGYHIMPPLLM